jgi:hypothetical protein
LTGYLIGPGSPTWLDFTVTYLAPIALLLVTVFITNRVDQIREAVSEAREWWRRRRHPRPVASFDSPTPLDEAEWAATLPLSHLRRVARELDRIRRRGRLVGEHRVRYRILRVELKRRLEASESPNRAPMDHLSDADRGWVRAHLNRRVTTDHQTEETDR